MAELKSILQPSNREHSVKEAVISLFFDKPIQEPKRFEALINNELAIFFQSYDSQNEVKIQFEGKGSEISHGLPELRKDIGFRFSSFRNGQLATVLQARNESLRQYLSYHTLIYDDWDLFFPDFLKIAEIIGQFQQGIMVQAFSLHYIDEFRWLSKDSVDLSKIFRTDSDYLPQEFFSSILTNYNLTTVNKDPEYYSRLDISSVESVGKTISISHNLTRKIDTAVPLASLISSELIATVLNHAHINNKNLLLNILNQDVCDLIKLKP